jgi:hypothetical protein
MLKHEGMATDEWHNNGLQDLIMVFLFIKIAIDKMQLCSLSVAYTRIYQNPTATKLVILQTWMHLQFFWLCLRLCCTQ